MDKKAIRAAFEAESLSGKKEIAMAEQYVACSKELMKYNAAFIHPYLAGFEITHLSNMVSAESITKQMIFDVFSRSFFNFRTTAFFIDGYFNCRSSLKPFCPLIDQSVFLCIQRDYAGAINVLMPVIEGSLRHYLVNVKGKQNEKVMNTPELLRAFYYLKEDYLQIYRDFYSTGIWKEHNQHFCYEKGQVAALIKLKREYIELWFSILEDYFRHSLYLDTRTGEVVDKLNRHSIFHGFTSEMYYSLENYLKIYNCIIFLSWAFGLADPNATVLSTLEEEEVIYKWKAFEKVRLISNLSVQIKSSVYQKYPGFDKIEFEKELSMNQLGQFSFKWGDTGIE